MGPVACHQSELRRFISHLAAACHLGVPAEEFPLAARCSSSGSSEQRPYSVSPGLTPPFLFPFPPSTPFHPPTPFAKVRLLCSLELPEYT